jgi:ribosome-associated protein
MARSIMFAVATIFLALLIIDGLPVASAFTMGRHQSASTTTNSRLQPIFFRSASFWRGGGVVRKNAHQKLHATSSSSDDDDDDIEEVIFGQTPTPLCDLQTFLRLMQLVSSGGAAKTVIQAGQCRLNGEVELRRAKKLFPGDLVSFKRATLDVLDEVSAKGYVYKAKTKKEKPLSKVDADGNLEFGGRFRSQEWRKERKEKKAVRKVENNTGKTKEE